MKLFVLATAFSSAVAVRVDDETDSHPQKRTSGVLAWAVSEGMTDAKDMDAGKFPKGPDNFKVRGVAATKDHKKGDVVLTVPPSLLMWSHGKLAMENMKKAGTPAALLMDCKAAKLDSFPGQCGKFRLTSALIAIDQNQGRSLWDGYVANLPKWKDFQGYHPIAADDSLLQSFGHLPLVQTIRDQRKSTLESFKIYKELGGSGSEQDFKWGDLVVTAYAWGGHGGVGTLLVPLGDSFNTGGEAARNVDESMSDPDAGYPFKFTATKDISKGSEIVDFYSAAGDDDFTEIWGFPIQGQANKDTVMLSKSACKELSTAIDGAVTAADGHCNPPAGQSQPGIFCSLARLAIEHCKDEPVL